jgi:chromosome segregation ATPase
MCITSQIKKLEKDLVSQEKYIKYLYGVIEGHEAEIEDLRQKNSELRLSLKNALETASYKEDCLVSLEQQLVEAEDKNIQLKSRINILQSKLSSMAGSIHRDTPAILQNMDNDDLLTYIRNNVTQMGIDLITKATTPNEPREAREMRD